MHFFKTELIIVFVFLTLHDAYGGEEQCVVQLAAIKYSPDKSFLDHYLTIFNGLNQEDNFSEHDSILDSTITKCLAEPASVLDWYSYIDYGNFLVNTVSSLFCTIANKLSNAAIRMLCQNDAIYDSNESDSTDNSEDTISNRGLAFFCDLLIMIHGIYEIDNAYQYCDNRNNFPEPLEDNEILQCQEDLQNNGFIFRRGLDNYAYHLFMLSTNQNEILIERLDGVKVKKYKDGYIQYLINEVKKREKLPNGTRIWCKISICEKELYVGGFKSRLSGRDNYTTLQNDFGGVCSISDETTAAYCKYLEQNAEDATIVLHGTYDWCVFKVRNTKIKEIHIT